MWSSEGSWGKEIREIIRNYLAEPGKSVWREGDVMREAETGVMYFEDVGRGNKSKNKSGH